MTYLLTFCCFVWLRLTDITFLKYKFAACLRRQSITIRIYYEGIETRELLKKSDIELTKYTSDTTETTYFVNRGTQSVIGCSESSKMSEVVVKNIDNACETAEEFTKVFYKQVDNSRHLTSKLYLDTGLLVWNGNGINGSDKIQKFLMDLPGSNHVLKTLDAQPISESLVSNKLTYLIQACGDVTYQNEDTKKPFQQTFLIVAVDGKWKIASDCFRLQVPYS